MGITAVGDRCRNPARRAVRRPLPGPGLAGRPSRTARRELSVSLGVSCSAHRNALACISADGVFLESLDRDAKRFLPKAAAALSRIPRAVAAPRIGLERPVREVCNQLSQHAVGTLVLLSGRMVVARDMAHAFFAQLLRKGQSLPEYLKRHPVFYAGPSETPPSYVIGSLGPTTAQRMDPYMPELMARDACLITLAKGPRAPSVAAACRQYGGFYLATVGGAAALVAKENVVADRILDLAHLGMEAVRQIEVKNLPALIVIDDKGNDLYAAMDKTAVSANTGARWRSERRPEIEVQPKMVAVRRSWDYVARKTPQILPEPLP